MILSKKKTIKAQHEDVEKMQLEVAMRMSLVNTNLQQSMSKVVD